MRRLTTALFALIVAAGLAHAGGSNDEVARKDAQFAAKLAAQKTVNLRQLTDGQFKPMAVVSPTAACDSSTADLIVHDDGQLENGYGYNAFATEGYFVDRFTPASYPSTVSTVCLNFITNSGISSVDVDIQVWADDGIGGTPGTLLGSQTVTVHPASLASLPASAAFEAFDISGLNIQVTSGSPYIGVRAPGMDGLFYASDESVSTPLGEGQTHADDDPWEALALNPNWPDYRSMMIRAAMPAAGPSAPSVQKAFAPAQITAGEDSVLTITLRNTTQDTDAVLSADLVDELPEGLVISASPDASTTCDGTLVAAAGSDSITLQSGASIPAEDICTISVNVTSSEDGVYDNVIPAGALQTQHGDNANDATASLKVGFTFPEPYCAAAFPSAVEPITRVVFGDIDNTSGAAVGGSPALENFTAVNGTVIGGTTVQMAVEGNTAGSFTTIINAYIDWNQDGQFDAATEGYAIGSLVNSTGLDGQQAVADIEVPVDAVPGETRMRVIKKYNTAAAPCNTDGYGQAEDYTITVAAPVSYTVTSSVGSGSGDITPAGAQSVYENATASFVLMPAAGYKSASVGGTCGGTLNGNSFETDPITADCDVIANFDLATVTLSKSFEPELIDTEEASTAVITIGNPTLNDAELLSPLVDSLPSGLTAISATTNCGLVLGRPAVVTADATSITLPAGIVLPAGSSCEIRAVVHAAPGTYVNTLAAGALHTDQGDNEEAAEATLVVTGTPVIEVAPEELSATLVTNTMTTQLLTIANSGSDDLVWSIDENLTRSASQGSSIGVPERVSPRASASRAPFVRDWAAAPLAEGVQDGGFELGDPNPYWDTDSLNFGTVLCDLSCSNSPDNAPHSGSWWAWFGGINAFETGEVSQEVTIPSGGATLKFWVRIPFSSGLAADYLAASIDGTEVWRVTADASAAYQAAYQEVTVDVSAFSGTHTLRFDSTVVGGGAESSNFMLDDVALEAGGGGGGAACVSAADVPWLSVDQVSGTTAAGSDDDVTVSFDANGMGPGTYSAALCVASNDPENPVVAVPVSMEVQASGTLFTVTPSLGTGIGTISPDTPQEVDENGTVSFTLTPGAGQQIAGVGGTCTGTLDGDTFTTDPVADDCSVVANFEPIPFPWPYCDVTFPSGVEPISRVVFTGIDNASDPGALGPALEDFLDVPGGQVSLGGTYDIAVEGNTKGAFTTKIRVYVDWNQDGTFSPDEVTNLSDLVGSTGDDGQQATGEIQVPADAMLGATRMRVLKKFNTLADSCNTSGFGQAEDYTIVVDNTPLPVPSITVDVFSLELTAEVGTQDTVPMEVGNEGDVGSRLEYEVKRALAERMAVSRASRASQMRRDDVYRTMITENNIAKRRASGHVSALGANPAAVQHRLGPAVILDAADISQMQDNSPGDQGVSCGEEDVGTAENSWWRRFYFSEHPEVAGSTRVTSVTVSSGTITIPGGLPISINLYTIPHSVPVDTIDISQLTLIGSADATITAGLTSITVPVDGIVDDTTGMDLVVEYYTAGNDSGGQYYPGANLSPETHPTFLSAAECGITDPTTAEDIGFPDFHLTMVVSVEDAGPPGVGCDNPSNVPWLAASPMSGLIMQGDSQSVDVTADASGLDVGTYEALLCISSNDPAHPRLDIPVTFEVTPSESIFCSGFELGENGSCGGGGGTPPVDNDDIVTGVINQSVNQTEDGSTFDFVTGEWGPYSDFRVDDINLYDFGDGMYVYWYGDFSLFEVGGMVDADNPGDPDDPPNFAVLQSGDTVGPAASFSAASGPMYYWQGGADGYIGIAFENEETGQLNYGYIHMTTSSPDGYPAQVLEYAYNKAGGAITIP